MNKPYAFVLIFHSEKENEKKYYVVEPYMNPIETELREFLAGKLKTAIKYSSDDVIVEGTSSGRAKVRDAADHGDGIMKLEIFRPGIREGVKSGRDDAFLVLRKLVDKNLEENILRPIIRGKNVRRWRATWDDEYAIYLYDENGDLVDIDQCPNVRSCLRENKEYLED